MTTHLKTFVYVVKDCNRGYYKIDKAMYFPKKKQNIELICGIASEDAKRLLYELHCELKEYKVRGKWFSLPQSAVDKLIRLA
jgi:hypothetical protein